MADSRRILVVEWIISLSHATRMMKKLGTKTHRHMGYYFELTECGHYIWDQRLWKANPERYEGDLRKVYADYGGETPAYILKVFIDKA